MNLRRQSVTLTLFHVIGACVLLVYRAGEFVLELHKD